MELPDYRDETLMTGGEESTVEEMHQQLENIVSEYVQQNQTSTNTQLFSFLALLSAYIPKSYLQMSECLKILGPPDPIHGGPPFEKRMEPFINYINKSSSDGGRVCMISPEFAETALNALANSGISRSETVKNFMASLCGDQMEPYIFQFIKDLLTKRELGEKGKEKFSRLIEDIQEPKKEPKQALSVLKMASDKFKWAHIFPQTISRLYYHRGGITDHENAEKWAKEAIGRAQNNSYVADTLGQVYKRHLMKARQQQDIEDRAKVAFKAFKDVEAKADNEEGQEMRDTDTVNISSFFNNRGLFGFIQVAKIAYEKLISYPSWEDNNIFPNLKMEVEAKFDFFEWYLTYSKPDITSLEPDFFWKDVVLCYHYYTTQTAAKSTSFAGLLDSLNYGLFTSKGKRAGFEDAEQGGRTVSDLEAIRDDLKTIYDANPDDDKTAERYILSNIILSNKNPLQVTPVKELQNIIYTFLVTNAERRSPEFYLLVLLLFWPEDQSSQVVQEEDDEEVEQQDRMDSDDEQETRGQPAHVYPDLFIIDLKEQVTFMEKAFDRAEYGKYLRGRYLLPLFFLGKGSGLSRWIHKSRLDAIVEKEVNAKLADQQDQRNEKLRRINEMWVKGGVWQVPEIQRYPSSSPGGAMPQ
ncbi:hypothetical protein L3Q82_003985 [Scortum barcoo]|uniref:Uncharacterized protein n=1 Tax=Scortum barcoo TaxID=214431 RepID=A0ACB8X6C9_9TELE|nr:hypothetical protein L3Q82_003985 [Scortum barcoo]